MNSNIFKVLDRRSSAARAEFESTKLLNAEIVNAIAETSKNDGAIMLNISHELEFEYWQRNMRHKLNQLGLRMRYKRNRENGEIEVWSEKRTEVGIKVAPGEKKLRVTKREKKAMARDTAEVGTREVNADLPDAPGIPDQEAPEGDEEDDRPYNAPSKPFWEA